MCVSWCACGGNVLEDILWVSILSLYRVEPGIEFSSSGLAVSAFTHLLAPGSKFCFFFFLMRKTSWDLD